MDFVVIQKEFERVIFAALEEMGAQSGKLSWFCCDDEDGRK